MTSHHQLPPPQLLPSLRLALACLYNLPSPHDHNHQQQLTLGQAQEFLIFLQSRNVKRRIESMVQKQKDNGKASGEQLRTGSSWLASLVLLCQQRADHIGRGFAASNTERLFASQTLLHRLIRSKLDQAIDWEIEVSAPAHDGQSDADVNSLLFHQFQHPMPLPQLVDQYQQITHHYHPFVGSVVAHYRIPSTNCDEDRVKGELSLLTLAAVAYVTALDCFTASQLHHPENSGPLLNALGSSVAAIALRLRFPPVSRNPAHQQQQQQQQQQPTQPLVTIITHAMSLVFRSAGQHLHFQASSETLRACLAAVPDICLGSTGGGARGRMSIDPKCLQEAGKELKTSGFALLWEVLRQHVQDLQQAQAPAATDQFRQTILVICERWARFLPLPQEFLQNTIPLARDYLLVQSITDHQPPMGIREDAFAYLCAIYESGSLTTDQILAKSLGLAPEQQVQHQQAGKKRQTSKSKKRQQEVLENRTNDIILEEARMEFHHRGAMACQTTVMLWEPLQAAFREALAQTSRLPSINEDGGELQIEGEGPIGCLAACANACLPHLLRTCATPELAFPQCKELFVAIAEAFQQICQSPHRVIRAFATEPMLSLHATLVQHAIESEEGQHPPMDANFQSAVVDLFVTCSMSLAISCSYPSDYFDNLGDISDEDLEIERNDVRDVIRTVAVSEGGGSTAFADATRPPLDATLQILARLLHACWDSVEEARKANRLFPETAVHCFSALAKPLNQLSRFFAKTGQPSGAAEILHLALKILSTSLQIVIEAFSSAPLKDIFPVSRVANLAIASLSPMLSNLGSIPSFQEEVKTTLRFSLSAAAISVAKIPELATPSELGNFLYDIRGAARGPGGEDHVGCLAIMRISSESEQLSHQLIEAAGPDIRQLCDLHSQLKSIEMTREKNTVHGRGATPKSRRILLGVICHLEIISNGAAGCTAMLNELFQSSFSSIASFANSDQSYLDSEQVDGNICEATWDIGAFSPVVIDSLFSFEGESAATKLNCLKVITACICRGYERLSIHEETQPVDIQWNRLRAAFFALLRNVSANLPPALFESIVAINSSECQAIQTQCQAGPESSSNIFNDDVVCTDHIPTGLFVIVVSVIIERLEDKANGENDTMNCLSALQKSKSHVLQAISNPCHDPQGFADPRPPLFEAWLSTMVTLATGAARSPVRDESVLKDLLVESCVAAISMIFFPFLSKRRDLRSQSLCMSFEGPHTLVLNEFLCSYFALGPSMLQHACEALVQRVPIDTTNASKASTDAGYGVAIIGAALYRAAQGALPPWAVESLHEIYASLFVAMNKDVNAFGQMLLLAMEIRAGAAIGSVQPGELLSGPLLEGIKETTKQTFLREAVEQCKTDSPAGWKRMKVLLKKFSGGKKTGTDFSQKPSPRKWEFERV